ncbi:MAG: hypothetical protein MUC82_04005 [Cypionkella sp.]|nr:hypothetical protein [Cypionkella sp.]
MKKHVLLALPVAFALSVPASAEPAVGLGVTFTWGGAASTGGTGLGLRLFSDNERGEVVGSLGVDYMITDQRVRPSLGVAYLASKSYVGMDVGYDFNSGGIDVGVGLGAANSKRPARAPAPVAPPPAVTAGQAN